MKKGKKGFTLAELLIVVAIISVLVAIAIPIFSNQLEKSREATDMANIRSAYAEIMSDAVTDGENHKSGYILLKQKKNGWQNESGGLALHSIASHITGEPRAEGKAWIEFLSDSQEIVIHYGEPVPGDQATLDAKNFPVDSNEYKILSTLADAERQALQEYRESGETKAVGYLVKVNSDGTFTLESKKDTQSHHTKSPNRIINDGYMVAVKDGKVGSNLNYNPETKELTGTPYHIYVNQWNNLTEGINFEY